MSQISEIPASAYTPEMESLGVLPDIPTFDGEPVPVSRNPLTLGTRPLQLFPLPGTEFPVRYETSRMRGFQAELRHVAVLWKNSCVRDCSSTRQSPGQSRDATVEMRGVATELRGASVLGTPYFKQLHDAAVEWRGAGAEVRDAAMLQGAQPGPSCVTRPCRRGTRLCSCVTRPCRRGTRLCSCVTQLRGEDPEYWRSFLNDRELSDLFLTPWDCEAWRTYPGQEVAELHTRSRFLMRGYWADRYFLGERVYDTLVAPA
ncbi:hypothetical protein JCGZ_03729 [Jatropha curcas]|uniref:Uncharacterized protein n=1 Tax=Jatropha curcas TaxID=180498 RepID=A0A067KTG4_JATCU|nr:hypothetical protein JCGZ_03729 [Jatropha curcas]